MCALGQDQMIFAPENHAPIFTAVLNDAGVLFRTGEISNFAIAVLSKIGNFIIFSIEYGHAL